MLLTFLSLPLFIIYQLSSVYNLVYVALKIEKSYKNSQKMSNTGCTVTTRASSSTMQILLAVMYSGAVKIFKFLGKRHFD